MTIFAPRTGTPDYSVRRKSLARLWADALENGMSIDDIAEESGESVKAIRQSLTKVGFDHSAYPSRDDRFLKGLFGPLFRATDAQAAEVMGTSRGAIEHWRRLHNISARERRH